MSLAITPYKEIEEAVERGAKLLNSKEPGWYKKIKLSRLDMALGTYYVKNKNSCGCVGAQLDSYISNESLGTYSNYIKTLDINPAREEGREEAFEYGLCANWSIAMLGYSEVERFYKELTKAWKYKIKQLKKGGK